MGKYTDPVTKQRIIMKNNYDNKDNELKLVIEERITKIH